MMLLLSLIPVWFGPILFSQLKRDSKWISFFDGFVFVSLIGLILFSVLPESFQESQGWSVLAFFFGIWAPKLLEDVFKIKESSTHLFTFVIVGLGFFLHTLIDGMMLNNEIDLKEHNSAEMLGIAVIIHRIPIGFGLWWLVRPHFGTKLVLWLLAWMTTGTVLGFYGWHELESLIPNHMNQAIQAMVAGSLLHIIFHNTFQHHHDGHCHHDHEAKKFHPLEIAGNVLGLIILGGSVLGHDILHEHTIEPSSKNLLTSGPLKVHASHLDDSHLDMATTIFVLLGWTAPLLLVSFFVLKKVFRSKDFSWKEELSRFSAFHLFLLILTTWVVSAFGENAHGFHELTLSIHSLPIWGEVMMVMSIILTATYIYFLLRKGARQYVRQFF